MYLSGNLCTAFSYSNKNHKQQSKRSRGGTVSSVTGVFFSSQKPSALPIEKGGIKFCEVNLQAVFYNTDFQYFTIPNIYQQRLIFFFFLTSFFFLIYFWLRWVFLVVRGLSLVVACGGYSSLRCAAFSLRWFLLLRSTGSRRAGFSSCGS